MSVLSKERLTERNEANTAYYFPFCFEKCNGLGASSKCDRCELIENVCKKLGEYEDLEEQGLLLRLPVAIGTEVWTIMTGMTGKHPTLFRQRFELSMVQYWGASVFLTRKETEEKLRELEGK